MTLYEHIKKSNDGEEITVYDTEYDMETYFYNDEPDNEWQRAMLKLAKLLTITEKYENGVTVNLSGLIKKNMDKLKEATLFYICDLDTMMEHMSEILSGNVSEEWITEFVDTLMED